VKNVADRAAGYSMPGITVDGNNPLAMYEVARAAVDRARVGDGPTLIEAMTFRFFGHVFGDTDFYMEKEEKARRIAQDPCPAYRDWLIREGYATEAELAAIETEFERVIDEAQSFALESPFPDLGELRTDVFADGAA
jgi:TPP-dependent pyruvate/acetoin dehydrogenase alpha subunit